MKPRPAGRAVLAAAYLATLIAAGLVVAAGLAVVLLGSLARLAAIALAPRVWG